MMMMKIAVTLKMMNMYKNRESMKEVIYSQMLQSAVDLEATLIVVVGDGHDWQLPNLAFPSFVLNLPRSQALHVRLTADNTSYPAAQ